MHKNSPDDVCPCTNAISDPSTRPKSVSRNGLLPAAIKQTRYRISDSIIAFERRKPSNANNLKNLLHPNYFNVYLAIDICYFTMKMSFLYDALLLSFSWTTGSLLLFQWDTTATRTATTAAVMTQDNWRMVSKFLQISYNTVYICIYTDLWRLFRKTDNEFIYDFNRQWRKTNNNP